MEKERNEARWDNPLADGIIAVTGLTVICCAFVMEMVTPLGDFMGVVGATLQLLVFVVLMLRAFKSVKSRPRSVIGWLIVLVFSSAPSFLSLTRYVA